MASITSWMRLEPNCRNKDMSAGLQARVYDPLWLLARQWQVGEFEGQDNGSPAMALFQTEATKLSRFQAGAMPPNTIVNAAKFDPNDIPLETLVERERVSPRKQSEITTPEKLRLAIEAGLHLLRVLDQQQTSRSYRDEFTRKFALAPLNVHALDPDSLAFFKLMSGRAPDGRQVFASIKVGNNGDVELPADLQIDPADTARVQSAVRLWRQWYVSLFDEAPSDKSCWLPERMEYAFSVAGKFTDGEVPLTAQEYFEGNLDWYDFDVNSEVSLGAVNDNPGKTISEATIPAPISFRGAPANRFWEFEDAQVDFGSLNAGPEDLARMLLVEFATTYGNDWFVIPVDLPVGTLCRSHPLIVTNTFGERFVIPASQNAGEPNSTWRMFQLSMIRKPNEQRIISNLFFLPPVLMNRLDSRPIEEVLFLRDEMANMAWAIEHTIESAIELPLNRFEQNRALLPPPDATPASEGLVKYRLSTTVPDNWVPLLPRRSSAGLLLERGKVLKVDGPPEFISAKGQILQPANQTGLGIFEEEIPREGIRVTRNYQLARWHDGSTHLWIGRKKQVGRGEGSSGLRFDLLEP